MAPRIYGPCGDWSTIVSPFCHCGPDTEEDRAESTKQLDSIMEPPHHTCVGSCTSVTRGCAWRSDCVCLAPPVALDFWHQGACGSRFSIDKRELPSPATFDKDNNKRQVIGSSNVDHSFNSITSVRRKKTSLLVDQSAHRRIPAPCNASYVSYACHDSVDGIVHEPPENWLGALLPEGATQIPPVPRLWRKIRGFEDEKGNQRVEVDVARRDD